MIKSMEIKKLFGRFDYKLEFKSENIMILTGPNGYGKSTILKIINYIANESIESIFKYEFESFKIYCNDKCFGVKKNGYKFVDGKTEIELFLPKNLSLITDIYEKRISRISWEEEKRRFGGWDDKFDSLFEKKYVGIFYYYTRHFIRDQIEFGKYAEQLYNIKCMFDNIETELGTISFIKEQRLLDTKSVEDEFGEQHETTVPVVVENSNNLIDRLKKVMEEYSKESTSLDSTYVKRLLDSSDNEVKFENIEQKLQQIKMTQENLKEYGFLTESFIVEGLTNDKFDKYRQALLIYISDMIKKYSIFESILNKLSLFKEILNKKLIFKQVDISYLHGIQIKDEKDISLKLTSLSSGEQEILVLYYKLIFESDVNVLLIDEPEISLHILWQQQFIEDLLRIVGLNKDIQIIIATHSPDLIAENYRMQIDLGGLFDEQFNT